MDADLTALPDDIAALKAALVKERARMREVVAERDVGAAELAVARARASEDLALIAHQKLRIAKLERQVYGQRSERSARLIEQLELELAEAEATATADELAAEEAAAKAVTVAGFVRKRPRERNTFPDHLPRERVVIDPPTACACCGGTRLRKLGEDVTSTLESIPRSWKVIETVREKFSCRDCENISQPPAPFHVIPRGWAGPSLLAMILFEKFGQHQPLNRQAERYGREGVPISLSTLADAVGAACTVMEPLLRLIEAYVLAAERLHGDDTTVPVLALGKCDTARCWVYVRDDRPFGSLAPPAAMFYYSRNRKGEHPQSHLAGYSGILQAEAFPGYEALYWPQGNKPDRGELAQKGATSRRVGRTRGGLNSKPHSVCDGEGRSIVPPLSEGQMRDHKGAAVILPALPTACELLGDRGYDGSWFRAGLLARGIAPCIPSTRSRNTPIGHDKALYRQRHSIGNMFGRLKDWRRIATRYDRRAHTFFSAICIAAAITFWLP